jgi:hypothetical protein
MAKLLEDEPAIGVPPVASHPRHQWRTEIEEKEIEEVHDPSYTSVPSSSAVRSWRTGTQYPAQSGIGAGLGADDDDFLNNPFADLAVGGGSKDGS